MEKLKKCPFCSGEAGLKLTYGFEREIIAAFVYCIECGASTPNYALIKMAKEAWNRRVKE